MGRRQDERRHDIRAEAVSDPRSLPMPPTARPSLDEWRDYRGRREFHLARCPDYDEYWRRPTPATAEAVWQLVAPAMQLRLDDFMPPAYILDHLDQVERAEVALTVKQALMLTLGYAVQVGRKRYTRRDPDPVTGERKARRTLVTVTRLFDQLAERWSDNYRGQRKQCRGIRVRDFTPDTARACWDDLRRNGIDLANFWNTLVRRPRLNPLFRAWRKRRSSRKKGRRGRGYVVELKPGTALDTFEQLFRADPSYKTPDGRLLLADEPTPGLRVQQKYAGDRPYDVVKLGDGSRELLEIMGRTRLLFNVAEFREDVQRAWRREKSGDPKAQAQLAAMLPVEAQLDETSLPVWTNGAGESQPHILLIKSSFYRLINRRYQPRHFWPSEARTALDQPEPEPGPSVYDPGPNYGPALRRPLYTSARARWFMVESLDQEASIDQDTERLGLTDLVGVDVSSSGTQILAVLLGLDDLEAHASSTNPPFKRYLANIAWETLGKHAHAADRLTLRGRYEGPDDVDLVEDVKKFWMKVMYGANPGTREHGSTKENPVYRNLPDGWTVESAKDFLRAVPQYADVEGFQAACKKIGREIADLHQGAVFVDPYDLAEFRWNPVQRVRYDVERGPVRLILSMPGYSPRRGKGEPRRPPVLHPPDPVTEDYPVDRAELSRRIAPCLVHMLDAYFASLVIKQLVARGVRDFVSIHDGWLLPEYVRDPERDGYWLSGTAVLRDCLAAAGEPWLRELAPVYERLNHYLGNDPEYGPAVRRWEAAWRARVYEKRWPVFASKELELQEFRDE